MVCGERFDIKSKAPSIVRRGVLENSLWRIAALKAISVAILLDARRAQACKAMIGNRGLPGEEFFDRERITLAGFLKAQQSSAHGGDDLCLSANNPATGI